MLSTEHIVDRELAPSRLMLTRHCLGILPCAHCSTLKAVPKSTQRREDALLVMFLDIGCRAELRCHEGQHFKLTFWHAQVRRQLSVGLPRFRGRERT